MVLSILVSLIFSCQRIENSSYKERYNEFLNMKAPITVLAENEENENEENGTEGSIFVIDKFQTIVHFKQSELLGSALIKTFNVNDTIIFNEIIQLDSLDLLLNKEF